MAPGGEIKGALRVAAGLALAFALCRAEAQQVEPVDGVLPTVLMIATTGEAEDVSRLVVRAVQSQLSDLDVTFRVSPVEQLPGSLREQIALADRLASEADALAVFWCDLTNREQVFLYLSGTETDRILVRRLEEPDKSGMSEALAIIVRSSIGELLRGGRVGIEVAEVVAVEPPPPALPAPAPPAPGEPPPEPRVLRITHRIGYVFETYSAEQPATHGLELGLGARVHPYVWVLAGYTMVGTLREDGRAASIRLRRHPVHLGLGVAFPVGMFELGASVAGVVDFSTFEVRGLDREKMKAVQDLSDVVFSVVPMLEARLRFLARLQLLLAVGVEIPVSAVHYVAETTEGEDEVILDAWPVQPRFFAGMAVDLW
ncbi:MAG: hypothetical protein JRF63_09065 [Deltaproteobacteria bacterium]|nr:hypothetical protein [Deltaproteobacteria bacterium]